jgi:hypothetical protein
LGVGFGARELIRAHPGEGRERAKARGLGRPFKLTPHQRSAALRQDMLAELWEECPEAAKDLYRDLVASGPRSVDGVGWDQRECLRSFGFANEQGKKLHKGCRLLEQFLKTRPGCRPSQCGRHRKRKRRAKSSSQNNHKPARPTSARYIRQTSLFSDLTRGTRRALCGACCNHFRGKHVDKRGFLCPPRALLVDLIRCAID